MKNNEFVYITFDNMLDPTSAQMKENYSISGITITSANLISNTSNSPAIVELEIQPNTIIDNAPYQVKIENIKGYRDEHTTMLPYSTMITLSNNKTLDYTSITALSSSNTITITFPTKLANVSVVDYEVTMGDNILGVESYRIEDNNLILNLNQSLSVNDVVLTPKINNCIVDINNKKLLNKPISVVVQ